MDFAAARRRMVDGQLKPNRVTDLRILQAMEDLPRERFVPPALASRALSDEDLPLGRGRVLMQPMSLARLVQLAAPRAGDRALVLASGSGYGAAVLARLGLEVTAVEDDPALLSLAAAAWPACDLPAGSLRQVTASPTAEPSGGPYDVIFIEGAVPAVPHPISDILIEGGRLVTVRRSGSESGSAILGRRAGGAFSTAEAFDCRTPVIPAFAPAPGFAFV
ncbi:protein-L-isoaspartate O-methyltransferase [Roseomonas sp. CCTCC AB2023176]|uniref:protein-L-isoaspartate O-methyltransferase family protein n=1 Tax=Roseomonas sp. CCTCC AB2023176 TaxID=3342640 RepID=UPI0035E39074